MGISKKQAGWKTLPEHVKEKTLQIMTAPKGAFSADDIKKIKSEFAANGVDLIVVLYGNNALREPQFQRMLVMK